MSSLRFADVYIKDYFSLVGPLEKNSRLKCYDIAMDDYYFKEKTFELAEVKMQKVVMDNLLSKNNYQDEDLDLLIGGDLSNQISVTSYNAKNYKIPYLGVYGACATFSEILLMGASFIEAKACKRIIGITSSHNLNAEKQFRYPVEYGAPKPHTATFTATASVGVILSNEVSRIKLESATIGNVVEMGIKDANNMGAVMAPAAADTLYRHLKDMERNVDYYDLILTGDLGCIGGNIFKDYLKNYDIKIKKHIDAGCELFLKSQDTYAGGSGPVCLPLILFNKIIKHGKYKKILIIGTGSLHSVSFVNQKENIPAVAHAISLEVSS